MEVDRAKTRPVQKSWENNVCFGCGMANEVGLQLESYLSADGDSLLATFEPAAHHTAGYPTMAYGGLLADPAPIDSAPVDLHGPTAPTQ